MYTCTPLYCIFPVSIVTNFGHVVKRGLPILTNSWNKKAVKLVTTSGRYVYGTLPYIGYTCISTTGKIHITNVQCWKFSQLETMCCTTEYSLIIFRNSNFRTRGKYAKISNMRKIPDIRYYFIYLCTIVYCLHCIIIVYNYWNFNVFLH